MKFSPNLKTPDDYTDTEESKFMLELEPVKG